MPASDRPYPSVWARPRPQERSTLSREQIVAEALRLLDAEGVDALSMRKLAARLESGATSLYWHVANRDELIELVLDDMYGELDLPDPAIGATDWQAGARQFAHSVRDTVLRHHWAASVFDHLVSAYMGPNMTAMTERLLALFEAAGFEIGEADRAVSVLSAYVLGTSMAEAGWHNWLARKGLTMDEWMAASKAVADETVGDNERVREAVAGYEGKDPQEATREEFEYGLDVVLAGLQSRLDKAS